MFISMKQVYIIVCINYIQIKKSNAMVLIMGIYMNVIILTCYR